MRLIRGRVSSGSLDFAGVLALLLEIYTSSAQFYVLAMCVAACAHAARVGVWRLASGVP
jgi:hypothetical protein